MIINDKKKSQKIPHNYFLLLIICIIDNKLFKIIINFVIIKFYDNK